MEFEFSSGWTSSVKDTGPTDLWALPGDLLQVDWAWREDTGMQLPRRVGSPDMSGVKVSKVWSLYLVHRCDTLLTKDVMGTTNSKPLTVPSQVPWNPK